jgi:hypothetical protein
MTHIKISKKRPAIRLGDPHSLESVSQVVERYGAIKDKTFDKIITWLDKHPEEYKYEILTEFGNRIIKTQRIGSSLYKITDNQYDAENTLKILD